MHAHTRRCVQTGRAAAVARAAHPTAPHGHACAPIPATRPQAAAKPLADVDAKYAGSIEVVQARAHS